MIPQNVSQRQSRSRGLPIHGITDRGMAYHDPPTTAAILQASREGPLEFPGEASGEAALIALPRLDRP